MSSSHQILTGASYIRTVVRFFQMYWENISHSLFGESQIAGKIDVLSKHSDGVDLWAHHRRHIKRQHGLTIDRRNHETKLHASVVGDCPEAVRCAFDFNLIRKLLSRKLHGH